MSLLRDKELLSFLDGPDPIVEGIQKPKRPGEWYNKNSPVQPSSIDLHIGEIFLPGSKKDEFGGEDKPLKQHILAQGKTAVVITQEEVQLPGNIAGIGFPPSRVSFRGILMTNPGHLDPGYHGRMRFTVINMGKDPYLLTVGKEIVTVLLFQLRENAIRDWFQRHDGIRAAPSTQEALDVLSPDFLDVERRAEKKANEAIDKSDRLFKKMQIYGVIYGGVGAAIVAGIFGVISVFITPAWKEPVGVLEKEISVLRAQLDVTGLKTDIKEMQEKIKKMEDGVKKNDQSAVPNDPDDRARTEDSARANSLDNSGGHE
jgi:deoxycytidine triphosphate deaminase